jgi:hypothetical protein
MALLREALEHRCATLDNATVRIGEFLHEVFDQSWHISSFGNILSGDASISFTDHPNERLTKLVSTREGTTPSSSRSERETRSKVVFNTVLRSRAVVAARVKSLLKEEISQT